LPGYIDVTATLGIPGERLSSTLIQLPDDTFGYTATWPDTTWPDGFTIGLFAGDELIIARGDFLDGKAIGYIEEPSTNDQGDMVARVIFADQTHGIVLARPIPEPQGVVMTVMALAAAMLYFVLRGRELGDRCKLVGIPTGSWRAAS
jgi:hypothetical protein